MPIRKLIEDGAFPPDALQVICSAFDAAWEEVAARVGNDPTAIASARLRLARAVLVHAERNAGDAIRLQRAAVADFLSSDLTDRAS
jgi:hypothetical protein